MEKDQENVGTRIVQPRSSRVSIMPSAPPSIDSANERSEAWIHTGRWHSSSAAAASSIPNNGINMIHSAEASSRS